MSTEPTPTVTQALSAVMAEVQSIGKTEFNKQQSYSFRGIDAVVNAVGPALRDHGVVVVPTGTKWVESVYDTRNGARMRNMTVTVGWRFYGPAGDYIEAETVGEAADAGDKATPKAHSVAYRILLLQALCIPTDDPDPDAESHERVAPAAVPVDPPGFPVPKSWPKVKEAIVGGYGAGEMVYAEFEQFLAAATLHLYGDASLKNISPENRAVMLQKASGAAVYVRDHCDDDLKGPSPELLREAWAHVLDGHELPIPTSGSKVETPDEEAARIADEAIVGPPA